MSFRSNMNAQIAKAAGFKRKPKMGAKRTFIDGYKFDSKAEAARYQELMVLERAKEISKVVVHPTFPIDVNGERVCIYEADFTYLDKNGKQRIEDVKGQRTALYILKKKLMKAAKGLNVEEVNVTRGTFPGINIDKVHKEK